ncbi:outer membrane beta-barrel protein [uncultured Bacteroides sp.]|uniref:outer membrane beta-barrel protein n=1 Tax=uncultured Bacteroides sp. TaxID=162156 RepID=UPI0025F7BFE9|nr:outer membrane beta-barrel protein [uncultured Bacteroides sp.]
MSSTYYLILRYFTAVILLLISYSLSAQDHNIYGYVVDNFHKQPIPGMHVTLLRLDSTQVSVCNTVYSGTTYEDKIYDKHPSEAAFRLPVKEEGKYILRFSMIGYQTTYKNINVQFRKRWSEVWVGTFEIGEQVYKLKETSIVVTKIKMVLKGDTIQYNADAFQLAEGSMLDALVEQLPGAELKNGGQIYVNGKYVEELLLNGKSFFKGDPTVALENLPAYMVNKIKVYEKVGDMSLFTNKDMGDNRYVMDVHLKKQYSIGWIANAEVGGGTEERYMARLFGLRFTPNSRLAVFANLNNMNDNRRPGRNGDWRPSDTPTGLQTTQVGGLSYSLDKKVGENFLQIETDNKVENYDVNKIVNSNNVTFLSDGDMFSRSYTQSQNKQTIYRTETRINFWEDSDLWNAKYSLGFNESFYYMTSNFFSFSRLGTFSSNPSELPTSNMLDSLFAPNMGNAYRQILINRQQQESMGNGDFLSNLTSVNGMTKVGKNDNVLSLGASFQYQKKGNSNYNKRSLDYFSSSEISSTDYRNQYLNQPSHRHRYKISAQYNYDVNERFRVYTYYTFDDDYKSDKSHLYRLDRLPGWETENTSLPLGTLPSTTDALQTVIDLRNSYDSELHEIQHTFGLRIQAGTKNQKIRIDSYLFADALKQKLDYHRNNQFYPLTRNSFLPRPDARVTMKTKFGEIELYYQMKSLSPTVTYLLDIRDDSDPLNIFLGNAELHNSHTHTTELRFRKNNQKKQSNFSFYSGFRYTKNAIAMGLTYNRETGVRTTQPDNINGNYAINHIINYGQALGKKQRWRIDTHTSIFYNHNVDLVGVEGATRSMRSVVNNLYLGQSLKLDYRLSSKFNIGAKAECNWTYATSRREDFNTIRATDFNYGLTSQVELPWKLQLSTDLTQYSRRGYEDPEMNKDELVWNARLSKSCMKGNLTFMFDGFDILGNLSNVRRTLNAQGRTESYYNVIPRYAMLHVIYKLNIQPKKKK